MEDKSQGIILDVNSLSLENRRGDLYKLLLPLTQLTLYPGQTMIDYGNTPTYSEFRDEDGRLILKLNDVTKRLITEFRGICIDELNDLDKRYFTGVPVGNSDERAMDTRNLAFSDIHDNEIFTASSKGEMTTVYCGSKVLGKIDATAIDLLSRPNVIIKDKEGKTVLEIGVNDRNVLKASKHVNTFPIFTPDSKEIGKLGRSTTLKGYFFGVTFSRDLEPETKALLISSSFILYSSLFVGNDFGGFTDDGGGNCCCRVHWKPLVTVLVVIAFILGTIIIIRL